MQVDFIDKIIKKQKARLSAGKETPKAAAPEVSPEELWKLDQDRRQQVDRCMSEIVLPIVLEAKERFEKNQLKVEVDVETAAAVGTERCYVNGIKLQLPISICRQSGAPILAGPSLSFAAAPPYSTTIAIVAYGQNNKAIFSERWELDELTEMVVSACIQQFAGEVIR
jgi:hypothetical protein